MLNSENFLDSKSIFTSLSSKFPLTNTLLFECKNDESDEENETFPFHSFVQSMEGGHSAALQMLKGFYHYLLSRNCKNNPFSSLSAAHEMLPSPRSVANICGNERN